MFSRRRLNLSLVWRVIILSSIWRGTLSTKQNLWTSASLNRSLQPSRIHSTQLCLHLRLVPLLIPPPPSTVRLRHIPRLPTTPRARCRHLCPQHPPSPPTSPCQRWTSRYSRVPALNQSIIVPSVANTLPPARTFQDTNKLTKHWQRRMQNVVIFATRCTWALRHSRCIYWPTILHTSVWCATKDSPGPGSYKDTWDLTPEKSPSDVLSAEKDLQTGLTCEHTKRPTSNRVPTSTNALNQTLPKKPALCVSISQ